MDNIGNPFDLVVAGIPRSCGRQLDSLAVGHSRDRLDHQPGIWPAGRLDAVQENTDSQRAHYTADGLQCRLRVR